MHAFPASVATRRTYRSRLGEEGVVGGGDILLCVTVANHPSRTGMLLCSITVVPFVPEGQSAEGWEPKERVGN